MARVKNALNSKKSRRTTLERAKGYRGQRSRLYRKAKEQVTHSFVYNYRDRKVRKNEFRKLWIQRINAACRAEGMVYSLSLIHISEPTRHLRISYAVFCLKKKKQTKKKIFFFFFFFF